MLTPFLLIKKSLKASFCVLLILLFSILVAIPALAEECDCHCEEMCYPPGSENCGEYNCKRQDCPDCNGPWWGGCWWTSVGSCGCFTGETEVGVKETKGTEETNETKEIKDLKEGDVVSSFNPETGEVSEGEVSEVSKLTREGYYELETESGKRVKVTAEHPFLAVENESFIAKLKEIFSHTLTYQLITGFQTKIAEVMK